MLTPELHQRQPPTCPSPNTLSLLVAPGSAGDHPSRMRGPALLQAWPRKVPVNRHSPRSHPEQQRPLPFSTRGNQGSEGPRASLWLPHARDSPVFQDYRAALISCGPDLRLGEGVWALRPAPEPPSTSRPPRKSSSQGSPAPPAQPAKGTQGTPAEWATSLCRNSPLPGSPQQGPGYCPQGQAPRTSNTYSSVTGTA